MESNAKCVEGEGGGGYGEGGGATTVQTRPYYTDQTETEAGNVCC